MLGMKPVNRDGSVGLGEEGTRTPEGITSLQEQFSVPLFRTHLSLAHHFALASQGFAKVSVTGWVHWTEGKRERASPSC